MHTHHEDETCYSNEVYFYHLACHKWVPSSVFEILSPIPSSTMNPRRGRFSHAVVVRGTSMLVIGGYNGAPIGTMHAYKVPKAVAVVNITGTAVTGEHCGEYTIKVNCKGDPACGWCNNNSGKCMRVSNRDKCSSNFDLGECFGPCRTHAQCTSCISWSRSHPFGCGWCVQDSRCYPLDAVAGACKSTKKWEGWWGSQGKFLTTADECRTKDFPPGLTVAWYERHEDYSQPDGVSHVSISLASFPPHKKDVFTYVVRMRVFGFVYPFILGTALNTKYRLRLKIYGYNVHSNARSGELYLGKSESAATPVRECDVHVDTGFFVLLTEIFFL